MGGEHFDLKGLGEKCVEGDASLTPREISSTHFSNYKAHKVDFRH
jgi:hypothetical protein